MTDHNDLSTDKKASTLPEVAATAVTITTGVVTGAKMTNRQFYKNADSYHAYDAPKRIRDQKYNALYHTQSADGTNKHFLEKAAVIEKEYRDARTAVEKGMGAHGLIDRFRMLKFHHKLEIGLAVSGVIALGVGAIVAFTGNRHLTDKYNELRHRLDNSHGNDRSDLS